MCMHMDLFKWDVCPQTSSPNCLKMIPSDWSYIIPGLHVWEHVLLGQQLPEHWRHVFCWLSSIHKVPVLKASSRLSLSTLIQRVFPAAIFCTLAEHKSAKKKDIFQAVFRCENSHLKISIILCKIKITQAVPNIWVIVYEYGGKQNTLILPWMQ